jgi:predicted phosphodiesterase
MRVAIFSDIHGNCFALDAMLADAERQQMDHFLCLGDAVQGGAQPAETVARLRELGCPIVMGNADAWLLSGQNTSDHEQVTDRMEMTRMWSLGQLPEADQVFIASFSPTVELALEGSRHLHGFHGSPRSFDDLIFPEMPDEELVALLSPSPSAVLGGGHTHLQQLRRLGSGLFFNPGSVGLVFDRRQTGESPHFDPWAEYAVLTSDGEAIALEFRRVPYAVKDLRQAILASEHPYREMLASEYAAE